MNQYAQTIFCLGYVKATIESLCEVASKDKESGLFDKLTDFEQWFNREIDNIFNII